MKNWLAWIFLLLSLFSFFSFSPFFEFGLQNIWTEKNFGWEMYFFGFENIVGQKKISIGKSFGIFF